MTRKDRVALSVWFSGLVLVLAWTVSDVVNAMAPASEPLPRVVPAIVVTTTTTLDPMGEHVSILMNNARKDAEARCGHGFIVEADYKADGTVEVLERCTS
jgi:hypothetical protein